MDIIVTTIPRLKKCKHCGDVLTYEKIYIACIKNTIQIFCDPLDKDCFNKWFNENRDELDRLRRAGL